MSTAIEEPKTTDTPAPEKMPPQDVINQFFDERINKPATAKEPEPDPAKEPVKTPDKPKAKAKAKKADPKPEPVAVPDYEAIATAAGRGVAEAMRVKEPEKPAPVDETGFLTENEREMLPILDRMEALKPDRYKGLRGKYIANLREVADYQAAWEKENPGDTFDPEDKAHNDFYSKHEVDWSDLDERVAVADMVADKRVKEVEGRTNAELKELRTREKARELEPEINAAVVNSDRQIFEMVGGEFSKLLTKEGGMDATVLASLQEKDPLALEVIFPEVNKIRAHCREMLNLEREVTAFNPKNPMHAFLVDYAVRQEKEIMGLPKSDQSQGGKKFATSEQWAAMSEKERATHWRLTASELNKLFAAEYGQLAVKKLESERKRLEAFAPKYGYIRGNKPAEGAPKTEAKTEEEDEESTQSPETTGVVLATPAAKSGAHAPENGTATFFKNF